MSDICILDLDSPSYPSEKEEYEQCGCKYCLLALKEARMSEILIIISNGKDPMQISEVSVDGKFAYRTSTPKSVEAENIRVLLNLMDCENYRIEVR